MICGGISYFALIVTLYNLRVMVKIETVSRQEILDFMIKPNDS